MQPCGITLNDIYEHLYYIEDVDCTLLRSKGTVSDHIEILKNYTDKYLIAAASKGGVMNNLTPEQYELLRSVGITMDYSFPEGECSPADLIAVKGGEVICSEKRSEEAFIRTKSDGVKLEMRSVSRSDGAAETSIILDGKEYSLDKDGLNIVVYDTEKKELADACVYKYDWLNRFVISR